MKKWLLLLCLILVASVFVPHGQADASTTFRDVGTTHRAQAEIYYLVEGGITSGTSSDYFSPDKQVTRQEAAVMIGRVLGLNGEKQGTDFKDVSSDSFASGYIQEMVDRKIITGYPDGTFKPAKTLTRGEMALLISRAFGYGASSTAAAANSLMSKGIAQGIGDGSFGAGQTIKRADFAVFLARSIDGAFRTKGVAFSGTAAVTTNDLNFRTGPSTSFASIGKLNEGDAAQFGYSIGSWYYIKAGSKTGFVHKAYVRLSGVETATPTPAPAPAPAPSAGPTDLKVVIDPGHGGSDPGAGGYGFLEKNVVLNVSNHMRSYFDQTSIKAMMTRTGDTYPSFSYRTSFAKNNGGDVFVSVHTNAFNGSANGQETYYYAKTAATNPNVAQSRALAIYLQNRMQEAWNLGNRGVKHGNYAVVRDNTVPAALIEMGFIDSSKDIQYIKSETERKKMGRALYLGVLDYFYHYEGRKDVAQFHSKVGASVSSRLH